MNYSLFSVLDMASVATADIPFAVGQRVRVIYSLGGHSRV